MPLRHVNKQVVHKKINFQDWRTAKQYMQINSFGFIFNLKSGYHHIDIFSLHQTYFGFAWKFNNIEKYFVLTVLPFGLQSCAYIFSKVLRPLVALCRRNSNQVVLYLDDGFGVAEMRRRVVNTDIVKKDIILFGLVPNKDRCVWSPIQQLEWLGFRWELKQCLLSVPDRKLSDLYELIILVLENSTAVNVRPLAKVSGKNIYHVTLH